MTGCKMDKHIKAPIETVFEYASDLRRKPQYISGITRMEVVTDGPVGVGTRFRESRMMFKREATEEMEVSVFDPPERFGFTCESCGCRYQTEMRFTSNGSGTDVSLAFQAEPLNVLARMMAFLMKPIMKSCISAMQKDMDDLATAVEQAQEPV